MCTLFYQWYCILAICEIILFIDNYLICFNSQNHSFLFIYLLLFVSENGYGSLPKGPLLAAEERVSLLLLWKVIQLYILVFLLSLKCPT
jgi:hypothetical protein